jgi:hypothetical protein
MEATKYHVEVQYAGETSWHYYTTAETLQQAEEWAEEISREMPGKVRYARVMR